jgi:hypothetical protein
MFKLNANAQQTIWYQEQLRDALQSGQDYDLIWHCDGATFRAHKLILAAFSEHMAVRLIVLFLSYIYIFFFGERDLKF